MWVAVVEAGAELAAILMGVIVVLVLVLLVSLSCRRMTLSGSRIRLHAPAIPISMQVKHGAFHLPRPAPSPFTHPPLHVKTTHF